MDCETAFPLIANIYLNKHHLKKESFAILIIMLDFN